MKDPVRSLEKARESLDGSPKRALKELPPAGTLPSLLRPDRDFVEAEALRAMGFFRDSERLYRRVLSRQDPREDPVLWVDAALGSAQGLRSVGRVREAEARLRRAAALARKAGLPCHLERIRFETAMVDRAAGRHARGMKVLREELRRRLSRKHWPEAAFVLWAIGGGLRAVGDLKGSRDAFMRSLALARKGGDRVGEGYARFGLGGVERIRGDLKASENHYALAGRIFKDSEDVFAKAYAACGLANSLRRQGRLRQAEGLYRKAHVLYSSLGDEPDLAYVDWGLGQVHLQRGELKEAVRRLGRALELFERNDEARGIVLSRVALAQALHASGKTARAETLFESAVRLARHAGIHAHLEIFT